MKIGQFVLPNRFMVAPMAGVTDRPFRQLCRRLGAGYAVSEMVTSRPDLQNTPKTSRRANHDGEPGPIAVQIAGTEPAMMAQAARYNVDRGAQIIDINMGCPAKKVCNKWAGSALMQDERLALSIVEAVVSACAPMQVPVTLKMRTGWCHSHKNALLIARAAESAGVQMVTVHGRTREQGYRGEAEYDTVRAVKAALRIPVVANGDIDTPEKARDVLAATGADAVMVGRAAQGRPWIFRHMAHFMANGSHLAQPLVAEVRRLLLDHLDDHYSLYGAHVGMLSARKHIGWYVRALPGGEEFRNHMNQLADCPAQAAAVADYFDALGQHMDRLPDPCAPQVEGGAQTKNTGGSTLSKKYIEECVRTSLEGYFKDLRGTEPDGMYDMMVRVVEKPLLEVVMQQADNNQSRAAQWLGLNRNTLRKKLVEHKLLD